MLTSIRKFIERGRRGYTREDLWSFDNFLSGLIANALRDLQKHCHSYPSDGITWNEWMTTLNEMIGCFEEQTRSLDKLVNVEIDLALYKAQKNYQKERLHRGLELLERYYYDLRD